MDTRHWRNKKRAYLRRHPKCYVCGIREHLQVHHKTYANLGHEPDRDLVTLCRHHHNMTHEYGIPPEAILEEGDKKVQSERTKQVRKKKIDSVLKFRLDPELIHGKSGDELNEIIEREKARLSESLCN